MKFITRRELTVALTNCALNEISSFKQRIIDHAEAYAIGLIKAYIGQNYDIEYELRPYVDYTYNVIYQDFERVRITNNADNHEFETNWGLQLIDYEYYKEPVEETQNDCFLTNFDATEDLDDELILVKKNNTCEPEKIYQPIHTYITGVEKYSTKNNPKYDETCGIIPATDGIFKSNNIINYYNTLYTFVDGETPSYDISTIDYSNKTLAEIADYQTLPYFDQYLLSNVKRDFSADDRNIVLVQICLDITVFTLLQRNAPRQISELIQQRYDSAIEMLLKIQRGDISLNLKQYDSAIAFQNNINVRFGMSKSGLRNTY